VNRGEALLLTRNYTYHEAQRVGILELWNTAQIVLHKGGKKKRQMETKDSQNWLNARFSTYIRDHNAAFRDAIKKGMKDPQNWLYQHTQTCVRGGTSHDSVSLSDAGLRDWFRHKHDPKKWVQYIVPPDSAPLLHLK